jgi:hypothetical protein
MPAKILSKPSTTPEEPPLAARRTDHHARRGGFYPAETKLDVETDLLPNHELTIAELLAVERLLADALDDFLSRFN